MVYRPIKVVVVTLLLASGVVTSVSADGDPAVSSVVGDFVALTSPSPTADSELLGVDADRPIPVPEDAVQPIVDDPELDGGLGPDEKLPFVSMNRPDGPAARGYAAQFGISAEEASDIIALQARINSELPGLAASLDGEYVGAEFVHPSDSVSGWLETKIYVSEGSADDAQRVDSLTGASHFVPAANSAAAGELAVEAAGRSAMAASPGAEIDVTLDIETGIVSVEVTASEGGGPDSVCTPSSNKTKGKLDGGRSFQVKDGSGSANCASKLGSTLGFSGYFNGKQGAVTASHCVDQWGPDIFYLENHFRYSTHVDWWIEAQCQNSCNSGGGFSWAALRPYVAYPMLSNDTAFLREKYSGTQPSDNIYISNVGFFNIWGFESGSIFPSSGTVLCQSAGKFSDQEGEQCGLANDWVDWSCCNFVSTTQNFTEVDYFAGQGGGHGSSGGPWYRYYNSTNVIGMGTHSSSNGSGTRGYYMRVDKIYDAFNDTQSSDIYLYCDNGGGIHTCGLFY